MLHSIVRETKVDYSFITYLNGGWGSERVKSIDSFSEEELKEGYVFHILTNSEFSKEENDKLKKLSDILSDIYPCQICTHVIDEQFFVTNKAPIWKGNYQTYFRFFVSDFVGPEVRSALYLDVDMLVLDDLRKLWAIDTRKSILMVAKLPSVFKSNKFNAGFIFFNLEEWRGGDWKIKCLEYTKRNKSLDQDTLNSVMARDRVLFISSTWDYCFQTYQSDEEKMLRSNERKALVEDMHIVHYIRPKPWTNIMDWFYRSKGNCLRYQGIMDLWWENALRTPIYSPELFDLKLKINNEVESSISCYAKNLVWVAMRIKRTIRKILAKNEE